MELIEMTRHDAPAVKDAVLIEGLPGVGNVGKLAADHLVDHLEAKPWIDIASHDFPPQVNVQDDGTVDLVGCRLWVAPGARKGGDLVLMTGDFQPMTSEGQYALVEAILEELRAVGCKELYTLGGYATGKEDHDGGVLGAATDAKTVKRLKEQGVEFSADEPGGGIIGASGLFLGLGKKAGLSGACLMGRTSGYVVDPNAAAEVIRVLDKMLGLGGVDMEALEEKAAELDRMARQMEGEGARPEADLHYIG